MTFRSIDLVWSKATRINSTVEVLEVRNGGFIVRVEKCEKNRTWIGQELWFTEGMLKGLPPTNYDPAAAPSLTSDQFRAGTRIRLFWEPPKVQDGKMTGTTRQRQWYAWNPRKSREAELIEEAHRRRDEALAEKLNPLWGLF